MMSQWMKLGMAAAVMTTTISAKAVETTDTQTDGNKSELSFEIEASDLIATKMRDRLNDTSEQTEEALKNPKFQIEASDLIAKKMRDHRNEAPSEQVREA